MTRGIFTSTGRLIMGLTVHYTDVFCHFKGSFQIVGYVKATQTWLGYCCIPASSSTIISFQAARWALVYFKMYLNNNCIISITLMFIKLRINCSVCLPKVTESWILQKYMLIIYLLNNYKPSVSTEESYKHPQDSWIIKVRRPHTLRLNKMFTSKVCNTYNLVS